MTYGQQANGLGNQPHLPMFSDGEEWIGSHSHQMLQLHLTKLFWRRI